MTEPAGHRSRFELPVLDSLRFVGALCVLTTHTAFRSGSYTRHGVWGTMLARLDVGVAIFFVLSGFLMVRPWVLAARTGARSPRAGRYYFRRVVRIYPVYAVAVVIALLLVPQTQRRIGWPGWLSNLTLTDPFTSPALPLGLTQMWSLTAEVSFYVVLPPLALLALGRRPESSRGGWRFASVLVAMVAIAIGWHVALPGLGGHFASAQPGTWLPAYLTWFAVGMGLAWIHVMSGLGSPSRLVENIAALGRSPGVCWTAAAGLMLLIATPLGGPSLLYLSTTGQSLTKHIAYAAIGGLVVITGVFTIPGGRYTQLMSHPVLRHLGRISYCVFCIHLPILELVMAWTDFPVFAGHGWQIWLLTLLLSLVAAELLHQLVEKPAQRLRNLGRKRPASARHSTTTTTQAATTR